MDLSSAQALASQQPGTGHGLKLNAQDGRMGERGVSGRVDKEREASGDVECQLLSSKTGSSSSASCTMCVSGTYSTASGDVLRQTVQGRA